jgi:hypothetical protein
LTKLIQLPVVTAHSLSLAGKLLGGWLLPTIFLPPAVVVEVPVPQVNARLPHSRECVGVLGLEKVVAAGDATEVRIGGGAVVGQRVDGRHLDGRHDG